LAPRKNRCFAFTNAPKLDLVRIIYKNRLQGGVQQKSLLGLNKICAICVVVVVVVQASLLEQLKPSGAAIGPLRILVENTKKHTHYYRRPHLR
jgi:hypothetical protein